MERCPRFALSSRLAGAFYELQQALLEESRSHRTAPPGIVAADAKLDPESPRRKSYEFAAHVVVGLRQALTQSPSPSLTDPLVWALDLAPDPFLLPSNYLALGPAKDAHYELMEEAIVDWAVRFPMPPFGEPLPIAEASLLRDIARLRRRRKEIDAAGLGVDYEEIERPAAELRERIGKALAHGADAARTGEPSQLVEFTYVVAFTFSHPSATLIRELLPDMGFLEMTRRVLKTLTECNESVFLDTERLIQRLLMGLGLAAEDAHDWFSYRKKRGKRIKTGGVAPKSAAS